MAFPHIESQRFENTVPLTETELDRQIAARRAALVPAGCGQQGRHQERCNGSCESQHGCDCYLNGPSPAEACTDLGADSTSDPLATAVFWNIYIVLALVAVVAAVAALV